MGTGLLTIDLDAIAANWQALDAASAASVETAAVIKADAYGLGVGRVARALAAAGARTFCVAAAEEGAALRDALGEAVEIRVFGGHMGGDTDMIHDLRLTPMLNSVEQLTLHFETLPDAPFGIQLDTGMNRLGMEPAEWAAVRDIVLPENPVLVMSHLSCADDPGHDANERQLDVFTRMTAGIDAPLSLAATGGIFLGPRYHFHMTRPGIGLYGGLPYIDARPVAALTLPVIQTRLVETGETVGYSNTWTAGRPSLIATVSGGYADGLLRSLSGNATFWAEDTPCPLIGRVSMDMIAVDVTDLNTVPDALELLGRHQSVDSLAAMAGTIGYEILTSLGPRYARRYSGGF
jgi:alanine racemase